MIRLNLEINIYLDYFKTNIHESELLFLLPLLLNYDKMSYRSFYKTF